MRRENPSETSLKCRLGLLVAVVCLFGASAHAMSFAARNARIEVRTETRIEVRIEVTDESGSGKDLSFVRNTAKSALLEFESVFGPLDTPLQIVYGAKNCLRVGYDYQKKVVRFCANRRVVDSGTESADVIRHELFHAMLCSKRPETCTDDALKNVDTVALHEGLADFFAYSLAPDMAFGEGFYLDQPWIRTYRTSLCYSLVSGAHEKGNAIVSRLVEEGKVFFEIPSILAERAFTPASLFDDPSEGCFASSGAPVIDVVALNHPASRLNRYYIEQEGALELQFVPNAEARRLYPEIETRWSLASNDSGDWEGSKSNAAAFRVSAVLSPDMAFPLHFSIFPPEDASIDPAEKWVVGFYSRGERIGQKAFYFTQKKHP